MPNINTTTTNLSGNDFTEHTNKAALRGLNLAQHRCMRANFSGMDLTGTNFEQSDCTDAIFIDAILDRANFIGAAITQEQIDAAKSAKGILLPAHLQPVEPPAPDPVLLAEIARLKAELAAKDQPTINEMTGSSARPLAHEPPKRTR
jgi:hypothetical protein